ncbi:MAG: hypothetical protein Fur0018_16440 [Anaerolineales bacterium]
MKRIASKTLIILLVLMMTAGAALAQSPNPEGVNTLTVSPDPAYAGDTVTITINFNATAGGDNTTRFCLYAPTTAVGTFPATITLNYYSGWIQTPVTFNQDANPCPARTGQTGQMYTSPATLPPGDTTYDGTASFTISGTATPGYYNWTLLLEEPGSGVNPLSYTNFQIKPADTPDTAISGRLIDSKTLQPWLYGAEIKIVQVTGDNIGLKGSTYVSLVDGTWSITFGTTDGLNICGGGCTPGNSYAQYQIVVNFTCDLETANGTRPNYTSSTDVSCPMTVGGTPLVGLPTNFEVTVTDGASGGTHNVGDIETHRGPTAIVLEDFSAQSAAPWLLAAGALLALAAGGFAVARRKQWL